MGCVEALVAATQQSVWGPEGAEYKQRCIIAPESSRRMGGQTENSRGRQRTELTLFSPLAIQMLKDFIRIFSYRAKSFFIVPSKARCQMQAAVSAAVTQPQGSHIPVQTAQSSTQDFAGRRLKHPLRPLNRQY